MYADGRFEKEVIGSVMESVVCRPDFKADWQRLKDIFTNPSLQVASFTITEKGYKLKDYAGNFFPAVAEDMKKGPEQATSSMGCSLPWPMPAIRLAPTFRFFEPR